MKKLALTLTIALGMALTSFGQYSNNGGLFQYGPEYSNGPRDNDGFGLILPQHGQYDDQSGAPLGTGIAVLAGLGGAYLLAKRRKEA